MSAEQASVRESLAQLVTPLRENLREVDELITSLTVQLGELRETKRSIQNVLKQLDPGATPAKRKRSYAPRGSRAPEILAFIESHNGDYADGLIYTNVFKDMKNEGIAIGKDKVRAAFLELHEQGVLRLHRKTMGGGNSYMLVGHAD